MNTNTPYDSMSKMLIQMDSVPMLSWLSGVPQKDFRFIAWRNTKFLAPPNEQERDSDLLAEIIRLDKVQPRWIWNVEIQSSLDAEIDIRIGDYRWRIKRRIRSGDNPSDRCHVGSYLLNLQGVSVAPEPEEWGDTKHDFPFRIINVQELIADSIMQDMATGKVPLGVLGWIPLMQRGNEPDIIQRWIQLADTLPNNSPTKRELPTAVKVFAGLIEQNEVWEKALKGWNEMRSKVVDAWIEEGRVEERRRTLLQFATRRFGNSAFQASQIEQIEDAGRLERMLDAILDVNSWDELLNVV